MTYSILRLKINKLNIAIILGFVAITGILAVQLLWTKQAFNYEEQKFSQKVHVTLLQVIDRLYELNGHEYPLKNPINKITSNYYIVNVNNDFDANMLEYCLKTEFERSGLITDFEYAIYKCESDEMVYGNYVSMSNKSAQKSAFRFPKQGNLVYYFAIRFPKETTYIFSSLVFWLVLSGILLVILLIYVFSIFTILQQKKYSELQRDFINNMTHEFKTPLSSILIASNYLSKQDKIHSDEKLAKYAGIIIQQSEKLNTHIEKILNIARSDDAPLLLHKQKLTLVPLLQSVTDNLQLKHESLEVQIEGDKEAMILADEFHFTNLVYNVMDNSIKYCDQKPVITIRIASLKQAITIAFSDNGIGIPGNKIRHIFDKFYRIPTSKSNEVRGFGLGLYYVKKICLLHGWKISASNNEGKGITISLLIPDKP